jgi:uncharacterized membrane protein YfcA
MAVFLLSVRLPKTAFVGTAAWFFMIINYLKLPLQYFVWRNITLKTILFDVTVLPSVLIGAAAGVFLVKRVSEAHYRIMVYVMTIISASLLFL